MSGGIKLTEDGGVVKFILKEGAGLMPVPRQDVVIDYVARYVKGDVFERSLLEDEPHKFRLGIGKVIQGWNIGVATMRCGEKSRFIFDSKYAYGEKGSPPKVPPNTPLEYEIELYDFYEPRKPIENMHVTECVSRAEEYKKSGNESFKTKEYRPATYYYREGMSFMKHIEEAKCTEKMKALWNSLHLNFCIACNNSSRWYESITSANQVLERQPKNPKARYLRGIAQKGIGMFDEAIADFEFSLKENPSDEKIKLEIETCKKKNKECIEKEKKSFGGMFKKSIYDEKVMFVNGLPKYDPKNTRVFMDISVGCDPPKKVIFELFSKILPKTTENFVCFCTGKNVNKSYADNRFHKIIPGLMLQGGDVMNEDGTGSDSIYGEYFDDEDFTYKHFGPGVLSMANFGPNTNGSQFFITFKEAPQFDKKNVVFGRVIKGMDVIRAAEKIPPRENGAPEMQICIEKCGIYTDDVESLENCP